MSVIGLKHSVIYWRIFSRKSELACLACSVRQSCAKYSNGIPTFDGNAEKGGDSVAVLQAGLPNILGAFSEGWNDGTEATNSLSGAVYAKSQSMRLRSADGIGNWNRRLSFDASRSSGIYGASTTVQPPALQLILQIRY